MIRKIAIYPGSFDPITEGHLFIIEQACLLFDEVIVTIAINTRKKPLFSIEDRTELIRTCVKHLDNVSVESFEGLLVNFAEKKNALAIIRGLRAVSDFEFESQMAFINKKLNQKITTVFLVPDEKYTYLNSTIVKEVAKFGGDVSKLVPPVVANKLKEKFKK